MPDDEIREDEFGGEIEPGDDTFLKKGKKIPSSSGDDFGDDDDNLSHDSDRDPDIDDIDALAEEEDAEDDMNFGDDDDNE